MMGQGGLKPMPFSFIAFGLVQIFQRKPGKNLVIEKPNFSFEISKLYLDGHLNL